ncbi:MAG TPA: LysR family transcriptional regulator [Candidatus Acidoferrum sp.]|nr:LysR family transcriptional regulator [Candidatus Acidoferrum sp.]
MELRHIRYFVAVAETGAFSLAATRLCITQPALWRQVRDLEAELGVRLFERVGRRVRVTSEGEGLERRSRELLAAVEQLAEHAHSVRSGEVGSLRVAISPQMIQSVLAPFLARFLKSRPGIDIHLIEEGGVRAAELVERGEAHLAFAVRSGNDQLRGRLLFPVRIVAAVAPAHRLARRETVDITDLQDERVLVLRHGFGTRETFDSACRVEQVRTRVVLESGDPQSLIALAEAGRGIALVPSTVRLIGRKVRVTPILQAGASLGMWGWIVWDPRRFLPAYATSFVEGLVEYTGRDYPGRKLERRAPPVPRPRE